ncbi:ABC transporter substrate-binding protein [Kitasatospora sp. NPDC096147]|uniref:ABC transporter substrate-binding protein n=1 Tax=Kitasatospora sp. NPDC096147 TaxID=3364093 RepID=UPI0037F6113E
MPGRKLTAISALAVAATLALSSCSSGDSGSTGTGGTTTLKVIGWKGGPAEPAKIKEINAAFEAAHPNIKIDYVYQPANDPYTQKLNAAFLGGKAEDVVMTNTANAARWGKSGYLMDLSDQAWVADLALPAKQLATVDGNKLIAQPSEMVGIGLFSNLEILASVGITKAPASWPEFLDALNALKKAGKPGLALPDKEGWSVDAAINATASSEVYAKTADWNQKFAARETTFAAEPGWKNSIDKILSLGQKGLIDYKEQLGISDFGQGPQDFKAGKSAFLLQGSWALADIAKDVPKVQLSAWPGGDSAATNGAMNAVGTMWAVNAKTKNAAAAKEYLKFWSTKAALDQYLTAESAFSPFTTVPSPKVPNAEPYVATVDAGRFFVLPENSWAGGASQTAMQNAVQALLLGQKNVDQTLAAFDAAAKG